MGKSQKLQSTIYDKPPPPFRMEIPIPLGKLVKNAKSAKNAKIPENKLNFKQKEGIEGVVAQ